MSSLVYSEIKTHRLLVLEKDFDINTWLDGDAGDLEIYIPQQKNWIKVPPTAPSKDKPIGRPGPIEKLHRARKT